MHEIGHNFFATHDKISGDFAGPPNAGQLLASAASCVAELIKGVTLSSNAAATGECWSIVANQFPRSLVFTNGANTLDRCSGSTTGICNNVERMTNEATRKNAGTLLS